MRKTLLVVFIFLISLLNPIFAKNLNIGVAGTLSMPVGNFSDGASIGFGSFLYFSVPFNENFYSYSEFGVLSWGGKDQETEMFKYSSTTLSIPMQIGGKYYFTTGKNKIYIMGITGIHFININYNNEVKIPAGFDPQTGEQKYETQKDSGKETKLEIGFAPILGYETTYGKIKLNISGRYQFVREDFSNILLNVGVEF